MQNNRIQYLADFLLLVGLAITLSVVFLFLFILFHQLISPIKIDFENFDLSKLNINSIKWMNVVSTFGTWVMSTIVLVLFKKYYLKNVWQYQLPKIKQIWLLIPFLFIAISIVANYLIQINQNIPIPAEFSKMMNSEANKLMMKRMLEMNIVNDLVFNVFIIAVIPALFEEIFFRATLQKTMIGLTGNVHVGILITAFLFAMVHLNLEQIIPMFFLAVVFGYIFHFTQSLWPSVILHFINNAIGVISYYYQDKNQLANQIVKDELLMNYFGVAISFIFVIMMLYWLYKKHLNLQQNQIHEIK